MQKLVKLNEQQFSRLFLDEEMHYPKFLDELKAWTSLRIVAHISDMSRNGISEDDFFCPLNCKYADKILVHAKIENAFEGNQNGKCYALYFNTDDKLVDGRIQGAQLFVTCHKEREKLDLGTMQTAIAHEITHLYDDWNSIRNGNGCICKNVNNISTTEFLEQSIKNGPKILNDIAFLAYMALKTEKQAFLSQTVQELETLGCNLWNYKDVLKKTSVYRNVAISFEGLKKNLENTSDEDLENLNKIFVTGNQNVKVPKQNINDFEPKLYREKLLKWAERVYRETIKSYGSVVQYYLDGLEEKERPKTSMYVR